jgi:hypothetical protein
LEIYFSKRETKREAKKAPPDWKKAFPKVGLD